MIRIKDTLGGNLVTFNYCQTMQDRKEMHAFARRHKALGFDTESTGINCYRPGWELRTFQIGNAHTAYILPAKYRSMIDIIMSLPIKWIGHNGHHDLRSIDAWLGEDLGVELAGETYIPAHHHDSRNQKEGGVGHSLKAQSIRYVATDAGKWEVALKAVFKTIEIPVPGETYKSGPRKGTPKVRKARLDEGWSLIDPTHPAYIAYAGADPILTFRLWRHYQSVVRNNLDLYRHDMRVARATDRLTRRAMLADVKYTKRLNKTYEIKAQAFIDEARSLGLENINSGQQIAGALSANGITLSARTPTGQYKTDDGILREILATEQGDSRAGRIIRCVLGAKQLLKRRESYTEAMLREMDGECRVHPSINALGARTSRMSVSNPPLQQLPTKDREEDSR